MRNTTVQEQGNKIPGLGLEFRLQPLTGKRERDIYRLISSEPKLSQSLPWQVLCCLAVVVQELGGQNLSDMTEAQRMRYLESEAGLTVGDAYFMYLASRRESLGDGLSLDVTCPACKEKNQYTVNLAELSLLAADSRADLVKEVSLATPLHFDKDYSQVKVHAVRFRPRELRVDYSVEARAKVLANEVDVEGYEFPLSEELLLDQPSRVLKELFSAVDSVTPGVTETTNLECAACKRMSPFMVSWEFPSFFA